MSFIGDLFSGSDKKTTVTQSSPATYGQPFSFQGTTGYGGGFGFNGSNSSLQVGAPAMQAYGRYGGLTNAALGRTGKLITDLKGNANPFINARIRPLQESINERRMDLSRGLSRRGVQGSLANNEMLKFDTAAQRELADQKSLLTQDTLNSLYQAEGLDQSVRGEVLSLADSYLKTSLSELGLSLEGMRLALSGAQRQTSGGSQTSKESGGGDFGSVLSGIGTIVGAF